MLPVIESTLPVDCEKTTLLGPRHKISSVVVTLLPLLSVTYLSACCSIMRRVTDSELIRYVPNVYHLSENKKRTNLGPIKHFSQDLCGLECLLGKVSDDIKVLLHLSIINLGSTL